LLACCALIFSSVARAAPAPADPIVELSPFVTTAGSEKGYVATSSLAGSRVNTPLKDIAAQIDVLTPEFLNDIAAINLTEAVAFSTNNGGPNEQNTGPNAGITSTRATGRARGFDAISVSADFYATNLPSDFYNTERLTIANGPQSILFGLGNAGGVIDTATKRAQFRDRRELNLRTDNRGSLRSVLDVNQVVAPQVLALRLVALHGNDNQAVSGAYNDQQRLFGAATWRLASGTTLRLSAERTLQRASQATNWVSQDYVSPWVAAGRPLYDNSTGNGSLTATAFPLLNRNTNTLRVFSYGGAGANTVLVWNGTGLTRGPHQLANAGDTRDGSLLDNGLFPTDRDPRVGARLNHLTGSLLRGAIEQRVTRDLHLEFGFNYETVSELLGGPFDNGESVNILADPNRFLPGGTAAQPQTAPNPNAGRLYIESYPAGSEVLNLTKEVRLTASYAFDFRAHFPGLARLLGRHRLAALGSRRIDEDRSQGVRAIMLGNPSFATGDLLNNSRFIRSRYYLDPATGAFSATGLAGGGDRGWFGPWTYTDTVRNETFQATMFGHPGGRTSATGGNRKEVNTGMVALQSYFLNDRLNLFGGRRLDQFKSYGIRPADLVRRDQTAAGDQRGLYAPLAETGFDSTPSLSDRGVTYSYGGVVHATRWLSVFASKSDNTALPPGFLDPDNRPLPGIFSDGYDYGFRVALPHDTVSLRVNFFKEQQHALIGDGQAVRTASATIEQRLRGSDRPAGIAPVAVDGYDPVGRGDVYRSVEDKIGRGLDATLTANLTSNWDLRWTLGWQRTRVFNKSVDFNAWVARRLPVWQQFGGLGWDKVAISPTDPRTVKQFYEQDVLTEVVRSQLRNNLPRYRQREWRTSLFTSYRFSSGSLKGLNVGGGARWLDRAMIGFVQRPYPDGSTGDDVTKPLYGDAQFAVDALIGYGGTFRAFGSRPLGWRVQVNGRNLANHDTIEPMVARRDGTVLDWGRVEGRQIILSTSVTF
jgi:outer membrane receptor protein involved in Fe transport